MKKVLFLMFKRKYLFTIFLLFGAYLIVTNIKTQPKADISVPTLNSVNQNVSLDILVDDDDHLELKNPDSKVLTCDVFEQAINVDKKNKANFISTKAIQWYFDGYDKYKIAETLAATFNYSVAMKWLKSINRLSRNHENHSQLIQAIDSLTYTNDFIKSTRYMNKVAHYQLDVNYDKNFDINQKFNQYPDLAILHWEIALDVALKNKKTADVLNAIKQLKKYVVKPTFFQHPLNDFNVLITISSFSQEEIELIIKALFDLSPVFVENSNHYERHHKQMLTGLDIDESLWNLKQVSTINFKADPSVSQLMDKVENESPLLNSRPIVEDFCVGKSTNNELTKIKVKKLNLEQSKQQLSSTWEGISSVLCPEKTIINGYISVNRKLNASEISLENLTDFENIKKNSSKLRKAISEFDEYERTMLFNILYREKRFELEQINELIKSKVTPNNSDFYLLIRSLSLTQQKELLLEHQFNLTHSNSFNFSIITSILQFGYRRHVDDLIPFLIEQGFPLKESETSPDPLWTILYLMTVDNRYRGIPLKSIASLIEHTTMNETHIDIMHKMKQKNINLYADLIEQFSELEFDAPEELIELSCF